MVISWSCKRQSRDLKLLSIRLTSLKLLGQARVAEWRQHPFSFPEGCLNWDRQRYLAWQRTERVGERWGTLSQIAGARVRVSSHGCVTPQVWAGRAERCHGGKVWVGEKWGSHVVFKAGAKGLIWENHWGQQRIIGRHNRGSAWVRVWEKRRYLRQTGRRKAAEHMDSRSTD